MTDNDAFCEAILFALLFLHLLFESLESTEVAESCLLYSGSHCSFLLTTGLLSCGTLLASLCLVGVFSYAAV